MKLFCDPMVWELESLILESSVILVMKHQGGVRVPGGLPRLQSGWDGRTPSGGFDSRPPPPNLSNLFPQNPQSNGKEPT